jgi:hypothetical protein
LFKNGYAQGFFRAAAQNRPQARTPPPTFTGRIGGGAKPGAGAPASPSS